MEGHAVEVGYDLVNRDWRSPAICNQTSWPKKKLGIAYPEKRSVRRDWIRTF